jgi:hypothetical protein
VPSTPLKPRQICNHQPQPSVHRHIQVHNPCSVDVSSTGWISKEAPYPLRLAEQFSRNTNFSRAFPAGRSIVADLLRSNIHTY